MPMVTRAPVGKRMRLSVPAAKIIFLFVIIGSLKKIYTCL